MDYGYQWKSVSLLDYMKAGPHFLFFGERRHSLAAVSAALAITSHVPRLGLDCCK